MITEAELHQSEIANSGGKMSGWQIGAWFGFGFGIAAVFFGIILTILAWLFTFTLISFSLQTVINILFYLT